MMRIIRTELRRSNAMTLALLITAVSVAALGTSMGLWRGQWLRFTYNHATALFVLAPLAMAGGAMLGRRERRTRVVELTASTGRPRWQQISPTAAAVMAGVAVAHLLVFAAGAILVGQSATYTPVSALFLPVTGVVVLTGAAWLGLAAGRAWPSLLVPPALAVVGLALQVALAERTGDPRSRLGNLSLIPQPQSYDWEAVTGRAVLGHLVLGAGLAAAGLLLAAAASWRPRVAAGAVLAGATAIAVIVPGTASARYYVDLDAQRLVCADGAPQVCVTAVHANALPEVVAPVRKALTLLGKLPGAPKRAVEWRADAVYQPGSDEPGGFRAPAGTVQFQLDQYGGDVDPHLLESILNGAGTTYNGCPRVDEVAKYAAGAWLLGTDDLQPAVGTSADGDQFHSEIRDTVGKLRKLPEAEQIRRVTALRDAAAECRTDLLPILTGGARP
jgi:hypothetical protein